VGMNQEAAFLSLSDIPCPMLSLLIDRLDAVNEILWLMSTRKCHSQMVKSRTVILNRVTV
jgi:hypothetical protein